jgi:ketosteroid isomerase-like protein
MTVNMPTFFRQSCKGFVAPFFVAGLVALWVTSAKASPEDDVRTAFDQFVKAQNAHDVAAVRELLLDSPNFLWVTRGAPIWGRDAALKRFEALYQGTWSLSPDTANLKTVLVNDLTAQVHVPITFNIGPPGQPAPDAPFLMNQTLVKTAAGWRIANILPIPLPTPVTVPPK